MAQRDHDAVDHADARKGAIRDLFGQPLDDASHIRPREGALIAATSASPLSSIQRRKIDAAVKVLQDRPEEIAYQHSVLCQTALPYRRTDQRIYKRQQGKSMLMMEVGSAYHPEKKDFVNVGLPWGTRARLLLIHLNSEAIYTQSPVISVEKSLTAFITRILGRSPNGREIHDFKEQLTALSAATIRLGFASDDQHAKQVDTKIVGGLDLFLPRDGHQRIPWPSTVQLSLDYFAHLQAHAVPLDERAIAFFANNALALDIYSWLAQRLHRIPQGKSQLVTWPLLQEQFGQEYSRLRKFREVFRTTLKQVKLMYEAAQIEDTEQGIHLTYSPPPVAERLKVLSPLGKGLDTA